MNFDVKFATSLCEINFILKPAAINDEEIV